ncbi:alpha-hydroxy acid oxidase [Ramlibacter solisilvae]|uniref:2-hydroxy-acid oxidase n=1 Tax=Ramlibacter tataouinensis TaxID=94132 RepID=A0A127JXK3_9BURK|nr:alpha-hydroxy-acid oxidizing protein [Ramlibacter tataouinensis]AMO24737.1 2-hydroxy-acid oxidase [Ramlibacter tataouinensis]
MSTPALQRIPDGVGLADYEALARERMDPQAWAYFSAFAGKGITARANVAAWDAIALWPRVLRPVADLDLTTVLFGRAWPSPLLVAPMALQQLAHPDGELATALAAAAQGVGLVLSAQSSVPMEKVIQAVRGDAGRGPLWHQLYFQEGRAATLEQVRRVEAAGFEALVLTVDASVRASRAGVVPAGTGAVPSSASLREVLQQAPTWDDIAWLRAHTRLPVLLKGILHPQDAREAARLRVDGVIVSNHGGRTLDSAPATALALPRIAEAVGDALPLLVDGGIVSGTDILKALALGARAVLVGRPVIHGLAVAGAMGVAHVLRLLSDELELSMAQCGLRRPADADLDLLQASSQ